MYLSAKNANNAILLSSINAGEALAANNVAYSQNLFAAKAAPTLIKFAFFAFFADKNWFLSVFICVHLWTRGSNLQAKKSRSVSGF